MKTILVLLLAVFAVFTSAYITNIAVDTAGFAIYITEDDLIYELDDLLHLQLAVHHLGAPVDAGSLYVGKHGNQRALYAFRESDTTGDQFVWYPLPLRILQQTLQPSQAASFENGMSMDATYDAADHRAVLSISRNLTLFDFNSFTALDTFRYYQNRVFGINGIYNHQNKHFYVFYSAVPIRAPWGLSVDEWDVSSGLFTEIDTTYNCLCDPDQGFNETQSPFYHVEFAAASCRIDYSSNPAKIWCPFPGDDDTSKPSQIFSFNANNLSDYTVCDSSAAFDSVEFDLPNNIAYGIKNDASAAGFSVSKLRMSDCSIVATYTNTEYNIDYTVRALEAAKHQLYLAVDNLATGGASKVVALNTATMLSASTITLNPNGIL